MKPLEKIEFTTDFRNFQDKCKAFRADGGGGDTPEDVFGGIQAALELKWSSNSMTKVILHVADAPPHGVQFFQFLQKRGSEQL